MNFTGKFKKAAACLLMLLVCAVVCACNQTIEPATTYLTDILTQKTLQPEKTAVTILVKYAFSINAFEKAVEEKFPDIDIIQVGNYTRDRGLTEYAARLEHDDLTDIVMTWPLDVGEEYWEDRLLDLSGMSFTNNYNISMLNKISNNGKLYYLPGPAQIRGIVYNKTLFAEKGWKVPSNYDEFVALCQQIENSGMRSLQLGFNNSEVLDTAFIGYSYDNSYSKPQDSQWISDYNNGKGNFGDHFGTALDTFQAMIDAGIWKKSDLDIGYAQREQILFTRQCAMVEDSVLMARMGYQLTGSTDEFALMPFYCPGENSDWARLYMVCYIGLNKHLAEPQNKEKYDIVMKLMDYISTPEGQEALAADTGAMYSSVKGMPAPDIPEIADMKSTLESSRCAIFPELKNAQNALRKGLAAMLNGTMTRDEVINMINEENKNPVSAVSDAVIASSAFNFTTIETGNLVTDAMRERAGTDIALFLDNGKDGKYNGKGISAKLYAGEQKKSDVLRILPDLKHGEKGVLQTVSMTGENLIKTLEYAIPVDNNITGWFYYFSGLRMEYSATAEPGSRIKKITDLSGNGIDPQRVYTIAVMDETVPKEYIISLKDTNITIVDLVTQYIKDQGAIAPSADGRFAALQ